jgi:hypothetical protein
MHEREMKNAFKILVGKPEKKISLQRILTHSLPAFNFSPPFKCQGLKAHRYGSALSEEKII